MTYIFASLTPKSSENDTRVYVDNYVEMVDLGTGKQQKSTQIPFLRQSWKCIRNCNGTETVNIVM